jgi:Putative prokaryotic signal transducing protein
MKQSNVRFMRTVCEPANSLEGHMLQDLLKQRGISARLDGAGLQSGVGELPAIGLVRLVVDDADFVAARAVIDEWEKAAVPDPKSVPSRQRVGGLVGGVVGVVVGIGIAVLYFRAPKDAGGIDHNDDGVVDERWQSSPSGTPIRTEIDRNFDGAVDLVWNFDRHGHADSGESDDDFDGVFETRFRLRGGQVYLTRVDTDGDSVPDLKSLATFGVLTTVELLDQKSGRPVRVEAFRLGRLVQADVDTDRDGTLDRRYVYDSFGEVAATHNIVVQAGTE